MQFQGLCELGKLSKLVRESAEDPLILPVLEQLSPSSCQDSQRDKSTEAGLYQTS